MSYVDDFEALADHLKDTADGMAFREHCFAVGPLRLKLRVADDCGDLGLPNMLAGTGISASKCDAAGDALTIYVMQWPRQQVNASLKRLVASPADSLEKLSGRQLTGQFVLNDRNHRIVKVFDQVNRVALLAFDDKSMLPPWELYSPIKEFLHLQALYHDCLLLHGATLISPSRPEKGVLLVGPSGSGKSTLTAYAIEQGMLTNGDDYVLIDLSQDQPVCWSVYRTLKLHPTSPALTASNFWCASKIDSITGKAIMVANDVADGGPLVVKGGLSGIFGISLKPSPAVINPNAKSIASDPVRHPYLHSCMSTIQQTPYRMDVSLQRSKKLHQSIPYRAHVIRPGLEGLRESLQTICAFVAPLS